MVQFASYLRRVLCKTRLIFPRINGPNVLSDQFQTVAGVLASDWCQKTCFFLAPIRGQNGGDRLELV